MGNWSTKRKQRPVPQTHKMKLVAPSMWRHASKRDCMMQALTRYYNQCAAPSKTNTRDPSINKTGSCKYYATVSTVHMSTAVQGATRLLNFCSSRLQQSWYIYIFICVCIGMYTLPPKMDTPGIDMSSLDISPPCWWLSRSYKTTMKEWALMFVKWKNIFYTKLFLPLYN